MQKEVKFYLGMDVSKQWLDIAVLAVIAHQKQSMVTERFDNTAQGIKALDRWLKKQSVRFDQHSLLVIENTGIYHRLIWQYCSAHHLPIYIGNATHIKWSFGIARGKTDKIDSQRLCDYAYRYGSDLKATPVLDPAFLQLKDLMTARSKLLKQLRGIQVYLKELRLTNDRHVQKIMEEAHKTAIAGLKKSLKLIEQHMRQVIATNAAIKVNYDLLITVPGIGHLTAIYLICCTNNFAAKRSGKQVACYAGVVPFSHRSGTSIKGRDRVHKMANKELKKLLHLCAMSAVKYYPEFRQYFERKKAEGKHPQSVLNAIRNKIVIRAAAVVNKQTPYVDNHKKAA